MRKSDGLQLNAMLVYVIYRLSIELDKVFHCVNSNSTKTSNHDRDKSHTGCSFLKILNNKDRFNRFIGRVCSYIRIEIDQN